jgi:uncharacterized protein (DUF2267 family)
MPVAGESEASCAILRTPTDFALAKAMTIPRDIHLASQLLADWLGELKQRLLLQTHNQSFAMLRGVLIELREQLDIAAIAVIGNALPPLVRGIFYHAFDPSSARRPAASAAAFEEAVVTRLLPHQIAPDGLCPAVFAIIREKVEPHEAAAIRAVLPASLLPIWDA